MKCSIILLSFGILFGCTTTNKIDWSNSYWGILESEQEYLYTSDSLTAIVDKEIKKGSILFFHTVKGDFQEVFTRNPWKVGKKLIYKFRYFLYKPEFSKLSGKYFNDYATIYELPFDPNQNYISGERGGCYYINRNGNKTYVSRSYCDNQTKPTLSVNIPTSNKPKSNTSCPTVQCSGRTQKGIRCKNMTT